MSDETKRFLIEQKVSFVNSAVSAGMLWWVSSILFCGSALAGVWSARKDLQESQGILVGLGIILFVFFGAIAIFGFIGAYRLCIVQSEIADLAKKLKFIESEGRGFFYEEIKIYRIAMTIGGGSFALIHVGWFVFWLRLLGCRGYSYIGVIWIAVWIWLGLIYWRAPEPHGLARATCCATGRRSDILPDITKPDSHSHCSSPKDVQ